MGGFGINLNTSGLGLGAGINVQQTVAQLVSASQSGAQVYNDEQTLYTSQASALNNINTLLGTLQTSVNALQDSSGQLAARVVTSSNSNVVTATAASGTTIGNHTINVSNLASTSTLASTPQTSSSPPLTIGGKLTFQIGSDPTNTRTITIDSTNNTLSSLSSYINNNSQTLGVTANVITDATGSTLTLASTTGGTSGNLTVNSDTTGLGTTQVVPGNNAVLYVDGVKVTSATNTVTGALGGVTLSLTGTSSSSNSLTTVGIAPDTSQASSAITGFVSAYNAVVQAINAQFTYTPGTTTQSPLFANSTLQGIQSTLANDVNYFVGNAGLSSVTSSDVTTPGIKLEQDGTLSVNSGALTAALNNNFSSIQTFFQQTGSTSGFAVNFAKDLTKMNDPTIGSIALELKGITSEQQSVTQSLSDFNYNLQQQQQQWMTQFSQVNSTLQTLPLLVQQITGQLGGSSLS